MMNPILIKPRDLIKQLSIPSSTLYRWMDEGKFPRPIKIGPRRVAFKMKDVESWLEEKSEAVK
ncbi:MAG: AlpA family phage regulatory protein [Balneolales bacterium]